MLSEPEEAKSALSGAILREVFDFEEEEVS